MRRYTFETVVFAKYFQLSRLQTVKLKMTRRTDPFFSVILCNSRFQNLFVS